MPKIPPSGAASLLASFWFYHIPGTRHGVAEWIGRVDHIVLAVGSFDSDEIGQAFQKGYQKTRKSYTVSHGYWFDSTRFEDGAYWEFDTFEISPLPKGKEANAITTFVSLEGIKEMTVTNEKKDQLAALIGADLASKLLANTEAASKELETAGVKFKEATPPPPATSPLVDDLARDGIKALAGEVEGIKALGSKLDTLIASLEGVKGLEPRITELTTQIAGLKSADEAREKRVSDLETTFKTLMDLSPAASMNPQTVIPLGDQYLQFIKNQNEANKEAAPEGGIFGMMLSGLKTQEGK